MAIVSNQRLRLDRDSALSADRERIAHMQKQIPRLASEVEQLDKHIAADQELHAKLAAEVATKSRTLRENLYKPAEPSALPASLTNSNPNYNYQVTDLSVPNSCAISAHLAPPLPPLAPLTCWAPQLLGIRQVDQRKSPNPINPSLIKPKLFGCSFRSIFTMP